MKEISKIHADRLPEIKLMIEEWNQYFSENIKRFDKFTKFVFKTSQTDQEVAALADLQKPSIEFNIVESLISQQRGEFAKQEPSLTVRAQEGIPSDLIDANLVETIDVVEAHLRSIFLDGSNDMVEYDVFTDLLAGGYSAIKVFPDYLNEMSHEQKIFIERFNPTMTVFDISARKSHKGDGRFCGELYILPEKQFVETFGKEALKDIEFNKSLSGFEWSFKNEKEKFILVCDFYEKKRKKETLLKLSNGRSVTKRQYDKILKEWEESGYIEQPPIPVKSRKTYIESICRYRLCENKILDYVETDYKYLPLVFIDGNSITIKESGSYYQMTRPYVYHAEGIQRLINFSGQTLAAEIENTMQHKIMSAIEAIPDNYQNAYKNVQKADVLLYNHFLTSKGIKDTSVTLPPPREISRVPIPPEISSTFRMGFELTKAILGNYDSSQGLNNASLSGIAFARSAIQSNNASMPYIVGYIKGLNRVAEIIVDLIPKYYRTPRTLPVLLPNSRRAYVDINKKGSLYMNYDSSMLQVKVEAGVNFAMQKELAIQTVIGLSQANQGFATFFNEEGLPTLLDNIDMRGIEDLKNKANEWMKKQKQLEELQISQQVKSEQLQGKQQQISDMMIQKQLNMPTAQEIEILKIREKSKLDAANIAIKQKEAESKFLEVMSKIRNSNIEAELKSAEIDAENSRTAVESAIKMDNHISNLIKSDVSKLGDRNE